jgi:hypothetical protein
MADREMRPAVINHQDHASDNEQGSGKAGPTMNIAMITPTQEHEMNIDHRRKLVVSTLRVAVGAAVSVVVALPATAHAYPDGAFQSPSGSIDCVMAVNIDGVNVAACQVHRHTYAAPPSEGCELGGWGSQIGLQQGAKPDFECVGGELAVPPMPTLDYGQTRSVGAITCESEPAGMKCSDSSTSHYFRLSVDSYELG